jgi:putative transposase
MPWKECKPMDERLRFVARLLEGEKMAPVCREFGISRATRQSLNVTPNV